MVHHYTNAVVDLFNSVSDNKLQKSTATDMERYQKKTPLVQATTAEILAYPEFSFTSSTSASTTVGFTASSDYDLAFGWEAPTWVRKSEGLFSYEFMPYMRLFYTIATIIELYVVRVNLDWQLLATEIHPFDFWFDIDIVDFEKVCYYANLNQINLSLWVWATIDLNECVWSLLDYFQGEATWSSCGYASYSLLNPIYTPSLLPEDEAITETPIIEETCMEGGIYAFIAQYFKLFFYNWLEM